MLVRTRPIRNSNETADVDAPPVVPKGRLLNLDPDDVIPSNNNPRVLFDPEPLSELKKNIREHGVLVPITVYQAKGQDKYTILDGARRHRCCSELKAEGVGIGKIPANIVDPPTKMAGLLYMFSIHNFREAWELMPTALSLRIVMEELGESDIKGLSRLTGLSEPQIERCKKLLRFPERFQNLSLDPNPETRIPSNLWIEALPVLELCEQKLSETTERLGGRDGITDRFVEKYRVNAIKSVIHFRRIMEAYDLAENEQQEGAVVSRLKEYIEQPELETRKAFDEFVVDNRRIQSAISTCDGFIRQMDRLKLDYTIDRDQLQIALIQVREYADQLLERLKGTDAPKELLPEE